MRNAFCLGGAVAGAGAIALAAWLAPSHAAACGGCFAPNETVTVVTGHRMVVSLSATETTLWDQIEYAGDPEDFVWVLPIQGEVLVELADNAFFEALDQATGITLQGTFPPLRTVCPDPCGGGGGPLFAAGGRATDGAGGAPPTEPPVTVYGEAVVGPYETATIGSDDPLSLVNWLQDHGYAVPDSILPTIAHYVDEHLNFAVLRLAPNAGVNQMQPVRVTTPGLMPVFPLRMVAAGVDGKVGLELYIIAEGRYGAANFDVAEIDPSQLVYDWDVSRFNYADVFEATIEGLGGRAWIAEYAQAQASWSYWLTSYTSYEDDGTPHTPADDWAVASRNIPSPYLTKLRTDLLAAYLDEDLILTADTGADISNYVSVANETNRPVEPRCSDVCTAPGGGVVSMPGGLGFGSRGSDGFCSATHAPASYGALIALGLAGLLLAGRRRRR